MANALVTFQNFVITKSIHYQTFPLKQLEQSKHYKMNSIQMYIEQDSFTAIPHFPQSGNWMIQISPVDEDMSNTRYSMTAIISFTPQPIIQMFGCGEERYLFEFSPLTDPTVKIIPYIGLLAPRFFNVTWYNPHTLVKDILRIQADLTELKSN